MAYFAKTYRRRGHGYLQLSGGRFAQRLTTSGAHITLADDATDGHGEWNEARKEWLESGLTRAEALQRLDSEYLPCPMAVFAPKPGNWMRFSISLRAVSGGTPTPTEHPETGQVSSGGRASTKHFLC